MLAWKSDEGIHGTQPKDGRRDFSMICWPQGLVENWPAVLEALATVALTLVAIFQWRAMRKNNDTMAVQAAQQQQKWKDESTPKAKFWLTPRRDNYSFELWCANLGTVSFLISKMRVDAVRGSSPVEIPIDEQAVVSVGTIWNSVIFDARKVFGPRYTNNAEVSLDIEGPSGITKAGPKPYSFSFIGDTHEGLRPGFANLENVFCPKCNNYCLNLRLLGMNSKSDCLNEIASVEKDFEQTCPNHKSSNSRVDCGTQAIA